MTYPGAQPYQPQGQPPPDNYLVWAILTTIFCCLPLGVASIVFSSQVSGKWQAGDFAGAQESAEKAKKFAIWSAIAGALLFLAIIVFYVIIIVIAVNAEPTYSSSY